MEALKAFQHWFLKGTGANKKTDAPVSEPFEEKWHAQGKEPNVGSVDAAQVIAVCDRDRSITWHHVADICRLSAGGRLLLRRLLHERQKITAAETSLASSADTKTRKHPR